MYHATSETSGVSKSLALLLSAIPDEPPGESPCTVDGLCPLSPGIEHLFVSCTAHHALERIRKSEDKVQFQHVIYSPHSTIEKKCGFDLSIGHFERPFRVRMMHKLLHSNNHGKWCDEPWRWTSKDDPQAHGQLRTLLETYSHADNARRFEPFLAIHVCYCIHEYRRMGRSGIPAFDHLRRTVIVDLREITGVAKWHAIVTHPATSLGVSLDPTQDVADAFLQNGSDIVLRWKAWPLVRLLDHIAEIVALPY